MEIRKFDLTIHDIDRITDLILSADAEAAKSGRSPGPAKTVRGLIKAGNNFLGHENIYVSVSEEGITGLMIGYTGKGKREFKTLLKLLFTLRLSEFASYMTLTSNILHGAYTPDVEEDEFYVSVLAVDEKHRGKGIGSLLLRKAVNTAKKRNCKSVLLDVNGNNESALALYGKFGFRLRGRNPALNPSTEHPEMLTMELALT
ncbi:MAG: GNAT family N-acetyltransferase [Deltaproteobacteria bacterium]